MNGLEEAKPIDELIRRLAVEQMAEGVISIVMSRLADGSVEVSVVREMNEFGKPAYGYIDRNSKEFVAQH
jgi:hypothetical protein